MKTVITVFIHATDMEPAVLTSMMLGPVMAILLLQWPIRKYEDCFSENAMFASMIFGIFMGMVVGIMNYIALMSVAGGFLFMVVVISLIAALGGQIIMTLSRFRNEEALALYGISIGMGMGSMVSAMIIYVYTRTGYTLPGMILMFFYSISAILAYGGALGIFGFLFKTQKRIWFPMIMSFVALLLYNFMAFIWYIEILSFRNEIFWELLVPMLVYSFLLYRYSLNNVILTLSIKKRRLLRRKKRKKS